MSGGILGLPLPDTILRMRDRYSGWTQEAKRRRAHLELEERSLRLELLDMGVMTRGQYNRVQEWCNEQVLNQPLEEI